ncbi:M48 family metallopeptidase [Hahella ganghwensis]|uniref:M48 family metallopeptidase n=1 Tax=Hahella ganghwensis TaxID=286420 RepID=UPI0003712C73|nr:M48 family metallopeptidase [Hahella ganghwensis]
MEGNSVHHYFVRSAGPLDQDPDLVKDSLVRHLNVTEDQAKKIVAQPVTLKKRLTEEQARRYVKVLGKLGLVAEMHPHTAAADVSPLEGPKPKGKPDIRQQRAETQHLIELFQETFREPIHHLPVTLAYKLGLISVMMICLIAPLIYFSLVVGAVYATWSYVAYLPTLFANKTPNAIQFVVFLVPILIGVIFTLFLAKPLFAGYGKRSSLLLDRNKYKRFYRLIELLAERMAVPAPSAIYVNEAVNASVGPEKGFRSLLKGELVLTVGLPLVAGMNSRLFMGIVAHEFGHMTQRNALLANTLVNRVNAWMEQCAFGEDNWDRRLNKWSEYSPIFAADMAIFLCRYMIRMTRVLMKYLFLFNLRTTRWMSREMEYDADRYESLVAGSDKSREIAETLRFLMAGRQLSDQLARATWNDNRLPDNLPQLVALMTEQLTVEQKQHISAQMEQSQTQVWDTHPADNDRIAKAEENNFKGIWLHDFPASRLIPDFDALCKTVTMRWYHQVGLKDVEKAVSPTKEILQLDQQQKTAEIAVGTFLNGMYSPRVIASH